MINKMLTITPWIITSPAVSLSVSMIIRKVCDRDLIKLLWWTRFEKGKNDWQPETFWRRLKRHFVGLIFELITYKLAVLTIQSSEHVHSGLSTPPNRRTRLQPNFTFSHHSAARQTVHENRLLQAWFPVFSTVCLELAATNSSHQWFSVCF